MNLLKRLFRNIFFRLISPQDLAKAMAKKHVEKQMKGLRLGKESALYPQANIYNLRQKEELINVGDGTHIRGELLVFAYGGQIAIGNNCYVGEGTRIWSGDSISIGNNVLIAHNCNIVDTNAHETHPVERARGYSSLIKNTHPKEKGTIKTKPIVIEDDAWISFSVSILRGVTIGRGAIVAAGSVVTKNVDPFTMVAGNPAVVKSRLLEGL